MTTTSRSARVIPLRAPEREKAADEAVRHAEVPPQAPDPDRTVPEPDEQPEPVERMETAESVEGTNAAVVTFPGSDTGMVPGNGQRTQPDALPRAVGEALGFLRDRLTGDYVIDEFGFDRELTEKAILPALRLVYDNWFRVRAEGLHNLPRHGGALLVSNHSGVLPLDALMMATAVHDGHPEHRHVRMLAADLVFRVPVLGSFARKSGHTLACGADAERLLSDGELVGVFPEGYKGVGKPFSARYKLQRFGRGGFVSAALRTGVPIIPVSVVGAEETYPKLADIKPLARLLGLPYFPITPLFPALGPLGALPLPTKWHIEFGEPIATDGYDRDAQDDPMLMFNLNDQVRECIQHALYRQLARRRGVFSG